MVTVQTVVTIKMFCMFKILVYCVSMLTFANKLWTQSTADGNVICFKGIYTKNGLVTFKDTNQITLVPLVTNSQ